MEMEKKKPVPGYWDRVVPTGDATTHDFGTAELEHVMPPFTQCEPGKKVTCIKCSRGKGEAHVITTKKRLRNTSA